MKKNKVYQAVTFALYGAVAFSAQAEQIQEQPLIEVTGRQAESILPGNSSSASKLDLAIHETPQAISVVNRPLIENQVALSTADILKNVSGVTFSGGEGRRDQFYVRGFDARRDTLVDGYRDDNLYFRDPVNTEAVEVLKGPSSVTYGRSDGGGMINRVTKKPTGERIASASLIAGSDNLLRSEIDLGNSLNNDIAWRLTAAAEDSDNFRDFVTSERYSINPSLHWQLSEDTALLAQLEYLNQERTPDRGIPGLNGAPAPVDLANYYGENYDYSDNEVLNLRLVLDHRFNETLSMRTALLASDAELEAINTRPNGLDDDGTVKRRSYYFPQQQENLMLVNDLTWRFNTGGIGHQLVTGIELSRQKRNLWVDNATIENTDLHNPTFTYPTVSFDSPYIDHQFTGDTQALYAQDLITLNDQWQLLAGLRYDHYEQEQVSNLDGSKTERTDSKVSPRLGVVFQRTPEQMFYGSAARSFRPLGQKLFEYRDYNWDQEPQESTQYEIGMKQMLAGGDASLTIALFDLTKKNVATSDPADELKFIQTGEQRSRGIELDLAAQLTPAWQLYANATLMNAEVTEDNTFEVGNRLDKAAERSAGIWSDYRFENGVTFGLGAYYVGDRFSDLNNTLRLPSYTRYDASVGYGAKDWDLRLYVENLGDKRYFAGVNSKDRITPGAPRSVRMSYTLRF